MEAIKKLGIWMDHLNANLMEYTADTIETKTMESEFTHEVKEQTLQKSESIMHNKENHQQAEYYKNLGEVIKKYGEVLLFGPTQAKEELFNLLKADHHYKEIKIEVKSADKMTENQQHAFVKEYFSAH